VLALFVLFLCSPRMEGTAAILLPGVICALPAGSNPRGLKEFRDARQEAAFCPFDDGTSACALEPQSRRVGCATVLRLHCWCNGSEHVV
jgi:hypothetical protein